MKGDGYFTCKRKLNLTTVKANVAIYKTIEMFPGTCTPFDDEVGITPLPSLPQTAHADVMCGLADAPMHATCRVTFLME